MKIKHIATAFAFPAIALISSFSHAGMTSNEKQYIMDSLMVYDTSLRELADKKDQDMLDLASPNRGEYTCPEFGAKTFHLPPLDVDTYDISPKKAGYIDAMLSYHYQKTVKDIDQRDITVFNNINSLLPTRTLPCTQEISQATYSNEASRYFKDSNDVFSDQKASIFESLIMRINAQTLEYYTAQDYNLFNTLAERNLYQDESPESSDKI